MLVRMSALAHPAHPARLRPKFNSSPLCRGLQAARACHEQFSADDMPLPLPRSTVDGIRQELRVVTQELLQRRMDEARSQQQLASAGEGGQARLQPAVSTLPVVEAVQASNTSSGSN